MPAPASIGKIFEKPKLRRAVLWVTPLLIGGAAFVILGPGFAYLKQDDSPKPPGSERTMPAFPVSEQAAGGVPAPRRFGALPEPAAAGVNPTTPGVDPGIALPSENRTSTLDCIIEPSEVVDLRSPVRGRIEQLLVERGDPVEADQVIVELESSVEMAAVGLARTRARFQGEVQSREARLELGQRKRDRAKQLYTGEALSVDQRDEAETEAKVARLDLLQARENRELAAMELTRARAVLERRSIRSPISGYVVDKLMSRGEVVDEETILRVAQIDPLQVEVVLPSAMYGTIQPGMRAAVVPEVPGDRVHVASVKIVDAVIDGASGTFRALLELPNPDHSIPGGLRCQVRFLSE